MLVPRAYPCCGDSEKRRETSCDVAMLCESYCLKDGSQQPRKQPSQLSQKEWHRAWFGTFGKLLLWQNLQSVGSQVSWELQRGVKLAEPANSNSVEIEASGRATTAVGAFWFLGAIMASLEDNIHLAGHLLPCNQGHSTSALGELLLPGIEEQDSDIAKIVSLWTETGRVLGKRIEWIFRLLP
jgi:hypothetical protein